MHTWIAAVLSLPLFATHGMCTNISGVVTDQSGKPIEAARIDHTGAPVVNAPGVPNSDPADTQTTDAAGQFHITTEAPAIVIRKPGYESQRLLIKSDEAVKVVLRPIQPASCKVNPPPRWQKRQANDIDYSGTWFVVKTREGKKGIISGSGPSYSWGAPSDRDVWSSVEYYENMYPDGIIDARGHTSDGKYWRSKTVFGAAAQYYGMDAAAAQELDCVMDMIRVPKP
jgi:hypothetical protein